jgi:hypothetical protein
MSCFAGLSQAALGKASHVMAPVRSGNRSEGKGAEAVHHSVEGDTWSFRTPRPRHFRPLPVFDFSNDPSSWFITYPLKEVPTGGRNGEWRAVTPG